jgi:hypothetical protein
MYSLLPPFALGAGHVRVSFFAEGSVLTETLEVLKEAGCTDEARQGFAKAVKRFSWEKVPFDYRRFPPATNGFYSFDYVQRLLVALPHKLSDLHHATELNCFDLAILLSAGQLHIDGSANLGCDSFHVVYESAPHHTSMKWVWSPGEAFDLLYSKAYQDVTAELFSPSLHKGRVLLNASLFQMYFLQTTNEAPLRESVLNMMRSNWKACGIRFPERFEVVLGHQVDLRKGYSMTDHAGVLFPRKQGFTYLEKAGIAGPFVRLDLEDKADLCIWFRDTFKGAPRSGWTHHFATFNDAEIQTVFVPE